MGMGWTVPTSVGGVQIPRQPHPTLLQGWKRGVPYPYQGDLLI